MEKHKFSAADLVKRSASQILYYKLKNERFQPTVRMKRGQEHQEKMRVDNYPEMRGIWELDDALIYFTWDEIRPIWNSVEFIEVKIVEKDSADWYFNSSILQTAFYGALSQQCDDYYTAKFARKKFETKHLNV